MIPLNHDLPEERKRVDYLKARYDRSEWVSGLLTMTLGILAIAVLYPLLMLLPYAMEGGYILFGYSGLAVPAAAFIAVFWRIAKAALHYGSRPSSMALRCWCDAALRYNRIARDQSDRGF